MKRQLNEEDANPNNPADTSSTSSNGSYACKKCPNTFDTFQAVGGHIGCHKKDGIVDDGGDACVLSLRIGAPTSDMLHQCKKCEKKFETGQALVGHMRMHRNDYQIEVERVREEMLRRRVVVDDQEVQRELMEVADALLTLGQQIVEEEHLKSVLVLAAKEWQLDI